MNDCLHGGEALPSETLAAVEAELARRAALCAAIDAWVDAHCVFGLYRWARREPIQAALRTYLQVKDPRLGKLVKQRLAERGVRSVTIHGYAYFRGLEPLTQPETS